MRDCKWAFIGASNIAREWMIDAVRGGGGEVAAVVSGDGARAAAFAEQHGIAAAYSDMDDMFAAEKPDAVYISSTNEQHKTQCLAAAAAGAHVLCEKPLALTLADAQEMIAACHRAGVVLAVNHHLRAAASHEVIYNTLRDGRLGRLIGARVYHAVGLPPHLQGWRLNAPQAGGGVVLDITVHNADLLAYLLGGYPHEVTAFTANSGMGQGVEDSAMSIWKYGGGGGGDGGGDLLCYTHESFAARYAMTGLELHGTAGSIYAKDVLTQRAIGEVYLRDDSGFQKLEYTPRNLYEYSLSHFTAAISGRGKPLVSGEDGARALAVALAVLSSAASGKSVRPGEVNGG